MKNASLLFVTAISLLLPRAAQSRALSSESTCPIQTGWISQDGAWESLKVPGSIGKHRLTIFIDTGAPVSMIDEKLLVQTIAREAEPETITAIGGDIVVHHVRGMVIAVAGSSIKFDTFESTNLSQLEQDGVHVDFIMGMDVLSKCAIEINADRNAVRIGDPSSGEAPSYSTTISYSETNHYPQIPIVIDKVRLWERLDTGSNASLVIDSNSWATLDRSHLRETTAMSTGLGGMFIEGLSILPAIALGRLEVRNVEVRIQPVVASATPDLAYRVLGLGLLRRFNTVIDLSHNVLRLSPRKTPVPPDIKSTSGVLATVDGDHLRIDHVMRNSPAAQIGLTDKDQICRIDGQVITSDYETSPLRKWSRDQAGRTVALTLCDGRQISLTLKDFY